MGSMKHILFIASLFAASLAQATPARMEPTALRGVFALIRGLRLSREG